MAGLSAALLRVACEPAFPAEVRLDALAAVPGGLSSVEPDLFQFLIAGVEVDSTAGGSRQRCHGFGEGKAVSGSITRAG